MAFDVSRVAVAAREYKLRKDTESCTFLAEFNSLPPAIDLKFAVMELFKDAVPTVDGNVVKIAFGTYAKDGAEYTIRRMEFFIDGFQRGWASEEKKLPMPEKPEFCIVTSWRHNGMLKNGIEFHRGMTAQTIGDCVGSELHRHYAAFNGLFVFQNAADILRNVTPDPLYTYNAPGCKAVWAEKVDLQKVRGTRYGHLRKHASSDTRRDPENESL